jgi:hypothetical protein
MKKNKLEIYELADIPAVFIEQVAENVLDLVRTEIEADNLDECAVMPRIAHLPAIVQPRRTRSSNRAPSHAACALFPRITVWG